MNKEDFKKKVKTEEDYIRYPKTGNSLSRFVNKHSEGVENSFIAKVLMIPEKKVQKLYEEAIKILRKGMDE